jgi:leader peptidase (prepilin peptidase)/N-methyltransferase
MVFNIFAFVLGAVVGSFLNVCICRLPKEESIVSPPSRCPKCGWRLPFYDNVPILSYLLLGGKCRSCREPISPQYPLVELANGLLTLFLFMRYGPTPPFIIMFLFSSALVVITVIDLEHQIIPDVISLPGIVIGFGASYFLPWLTWKDSLMGIVLGGGSLLLVATVYEAITKKEGMGGGDIKLLAMMGAFLGWRSVPFIIFAGSLAGSIIGISVMTARKQDARLSIPFGPFLAFGAVLYIFFGRQIIHWYFITMGRGFGG